jgi:hypothetical protein
MDHLDVPQFLGLLVVILGTAKLFGVAEKWIGQTTNPDLKRHYLDLIDRMERIGDMSIADELNKIDR